MSKPDRKEDTPGSGSIIAGLTNRSGLFLFSYSSQMKALVSWSENVEEILGVGYHNVNRDGNLFLRYVHPDDRFDLLSQLEAALSGESSYTVTYRWIRPDSNKTVWLHCRASQSERNGEALFEGFIIDLSKEMYAAPQKGNLIDSAEAVLQALPEATITLDGDLIVVRSNLFPDGSADSCQPFSPDRSWCDFGDPHFHFEKLTVGTPIRECFHSETLRRSFERNCQEVLNGSQLSYQARIVCGKSTGSLRIDPIFIRGSAEGVLVSVRNVSAQIESEESLKQLQKTEGLRAIAVGLAHNFNNSLQTIIGQAITIRDNTAQPTLVQQASQIILNVSQKASLLTHELFRLNSADNNQPAPVDVNLAAMSAVNRIEDLFASGFKVAVAFGNPPVIVAKQMEIEDLIEGVLRSIRAVPGETGNISVSTSHAQVKAEEISSLPGGSYARLTLSESAPAGAVRNLNDLEHNELLMRSKEKAESLRGCLEVSRNRHDGFTFALFLPVSGEQSSTEEEAPLLKTDETESPVVLIVDDDLLVLETVHTILTDNGIKCVTAADYQSALVLARTFSNSLRVVLLDILMPDMDGPSLLPQLKKQNSDLIVIGFTGAPPEIANRMLEKGAARILYKPASPAELLEALKDVLREREAA